MSNFIKNILLKISCIIFLVLTLLLIVAVAIIGFTSSETALDVVLDSDIFSLTTSLNNCNRIATSDTVLFLTTLVEVDIEAIIGAP